MMSRIGATTITAMKQGQRSHASGPSRPVWRRFAAREGFTLLEVLISLSILGVGAALTLSLISGSLLNIRKVQDRTRSIEHAESVLELSLLDDTILGPTSLRGDFPDGTLWALEVRDHAGPVIPGAGLGPPGFPSLPGAGAGNVAGQFPYRLLSYAVNIIDPESGRSKYQLHTLKLINTRDPVGATPGPPR